MIMGLHQNKKILEELERLREEMYSAYKNKAGREIILDISRKIDACIVEYYRNTDPVKDESSNAR